MNRVIHRDKSGKVDIFKALVIAHWKKFPECSVATISITEDKPNRSGAQNRLYSRWVDIIRNETGNSKQDMRFYLADMFLDKVDYTDKQGKNMPQIRSTTDLKVAEFVDFLCEVEMFANEWGINLEHDDEYQFALHGKRQ